MQRFSHFMESDSDSDSKPNHQLQEWDWNESESIPESIFRHVNEPLQSSYLTTSRRCAPACCMPCKPMNNLSISFVPCKNTYSAFQFRPKVHSHWARDTQGDFFLWTWNSAQYAPVYKNNGLWTSPLVTRKPIFDQHIYRAEFRYVWTDLEYDSRCAHLEAISLSISLRYKRVLSQGLFKPSVTVRFLLSYFSAYVQTKSDIKLSPLWKKKSGKVECRSRSYV